MTEGRCVCKKKKKSPTLNQDISAQRTTRSPTRCLGAHRSTTSSYCRRRGGLSRAPAWSTHGRLLRDSGHSARGALLLPLTRASPRWSRRAGPGLAWRERLRVPAPERVAARGSQLLHEQPQIAATLLVPHWPAQAWFQRLASIADEAVTRPLHEVAAPPGWLPGSAQHALSAARC